MVPYTLVALALVTAANAAPTFTERDLNSTKWTSDHILQPDEIILYGEDGRMEVIHESVYQRMIASEGFSLDAPDVDTDWLKRPASNMSESRLASRDSVSCDNTRSAIADSSSTFVDWDVQMSPVVIGGTSTSIDVYVSSGYSVANAVTVSASADLTFIKDALGASLGIDYTRTWTTQTVINIKGTVAANYSGVMITKPIKTRKYGRQFSGCLGALTEVGSWMADSYAEGSYGGVSWVSGAITMCTKQEFPLSRCSGSGDFV